MEEADDIMVSIGAIFEVVQEKFVEAADGMHKGLPPGAPVRWTGLEGDVRADTSRLAPWAQEVIAAEEPGKLLEAGL